MVDPLHHSSMSVAAQTGGSSEEQSKSQLIGNEYQLLKDLGEGTFGKVKLGRHVPSGQLVAVKILEKRRITDKADRERVAREMSILKSIRHSNIIKLYEIIETTTRVFLIMEYACGGELFDYIVRKDRLTEKEACRFYNQIIAGIEFLHSKGIAHRDLKPENLLLDKGKNLKFVDFGLSNTYKTGETLVTACGSPCYAAPEMIAGRRYHGIEVDIWSSGVTLYAMLCGFLPFEDPDTALLYKKILRGDFELPDFLSNRSIKFLKQVLCIDPTKRLTIQQIKEHSWFNQSDTSQHSMFPLDKQRSPNQLLLSGEVQANMYNTQIYGVQENNSSLLSQPRENMTQQIVVTETSKKCSTQYKKAFSQQDRDTSHYNYYAQANQSGTDNISLTNKSQQKMLIKDFTTNDKEEIQERLSKTTVAPSTFRVNVSDGRKSVQSKQGLVKPQRPSTGMRKNNPTLVQKHLEKKHGSPKSQTHTCVHTIGHIYAKTKGQIGQQNLVKESTNMQTNIVIDLAAPSTGGSTDCAAQTNRPQIRARNEFTPQQKHTGKFEVFSSQTHKHKKTPIFQMRKILDYQTEQKQSLQTQVQVSKKRGSAKAFEEQRNSVTSRNQIPLRTLTDPKIITQKQAAINQINDQKTLKNQINEISQTQRIHPYSIMALPSTKSVVETKNISFQAEISRLKSPKLNLIQQKLKFNHHQQLKKLASAENYSSVISKRAFKPHKTLYLSNDQPKILTKTNGQPSLSLQSKKNPKYKSTEEHKIFNLTPKVKMDSIKKSHTKTNTITSIQEELRIEDQKEAIISKPQTYQNINEINGIQEATLQPLFFKPVEISQTKISHQPTPTSYRSESAQTEQIKVTHESLPTVGEDTAKIDLKLLSYQPSKPTTKTLLLTPSCQTTYQNQNKPPNSIINNANNTSSVNAMRIFSCSTVPTDWLSAKQPDQILTEVEEALSKTDKMIPPFEQSIKRKSKFLIQVKLSLSMQANNSDDVGVQQKESLLVENCFCQEFLKVEIELMMLKNAPFITVIRVALKKKQQNRNRHRIADDDNGQETNKKFVLKEKIARYTAFCTILRELLCLD